MGRPKKVSAVVTGLNTSSTETPDPFSQNLTQEANLLAEAKKKFKLDEVDGFTKFIQELLKLEAPPLFKRDFTDPRWPRNEVGENMTV